MRTGKNRLNERNLFAALHKETLASRRIHPSTLYIRNVCGNVSSLVPS